MPKIGGEREEDPKKRHELLISYETKSADGTCEFEPKTFRPWVDGSRQQKKTKREEIRA